MSGATIVLVLELDCAGDCPRGTARLSLGEPRHFHGWLELAGAIADLASGTDDGDPLATTDLAPTNEGAPR